jgi:hypothetical protein
MKPIKLFTVALSLLIVFTSASCSGSVSTANITDAYTTHLVNGVDEKTTIFSQDENFALVVELTNVTDDTATSAKWYAVKAEGVEPNLLLDEADFKGADPEIVFDLKNNQLWPIGEYKVELFLNGKLNKTIEFSVISSPSAAAEQGQGMYLAYMVSQTTGDRVETYVYSVDEPFNAIVDLTSAPDDTVTKAVWTAVDVEGVEFNTLIDEVELEGSGELTFDLTNNGPWPPGIYQVEIFVNGTLDSTLQFAVELN